MNETLNMKLSYFFILLPWKSEDSKPTCGWVISLADHATAVSDIFATSFQESSSKTTVSRMKFKYTFKITVLFLNLNIQ